MKDSVSMQKEIKEEKITLQNLKNKKIYFDTD
jgi:hypothetical protein